MRLRDLEHQNERQCQSNKAEVTSWPQLQAALQLTLSTFKPLCWSTSPWIFACIWKTKFVSWHVFEKGFCKRISYNQNVLAHHGLRTGEMETRSNTSHFMRLIGVFQNEERTDKRTYGRTNKPSYRDTSTKKGERWAQEAHIKDQG